LKQTVSSAAVAWYYIMSIEEIITLKRLCFGHILRWSYYIPFE